MNGCVAVLDLGKTNTKLVVFDRAGELVAERSQASAPLAPDDGGPTSGSTPSARGRSISAR